jgi:hypothetical protein
LYTRLLNMSLDKVVELHLAHAEACFPRGEFVRANREKATCMAGDKY